MYRLIGILTEMGSIVGFNLIHMESGKVAAGNLDSLYKIIKSGKKVHGVEIAEMQGRELAVSGSKSSLRVQLHAQGEPDYCIQCTSGRRLGDYPALDIKTRKIKNHGMVTLLHREVQGTTITAYYFCRFDGKQIRVPSQQIESVVDNGRRLTNASVVNGEHGKYIQFDDEVTDKYTLSSYNIEAPWEKTSNPKEMSWNLAEFEAYMKANGLKYKIEGQKLVHVQLNSEWLVTPIGIYILGSEAVTDGPNKIKVVLSETTHTVEEGAFSTKIITGLTIKSKQLDARGINGTQIACEIIELNGVNKIHNFMNYDTATKNVAIVASGSVRLANCFNGVRLKGLKIAVDGDIDSKSSFNNVNCDVFYLKSDKFSSDGKEIIRLSIKERGMVQTSFSKYITMNINCKGEFIHKATGEPAISGAFKTLHIVGQETMDCISDPKLDSRPLDAGSTYVECEIVRLMPSTYTSGILYLCEGVKECEIDSEWHKSVKMEAYAVSIPSSLKKWDPEWFNRIRWIRVVVLNDKAFEESGYIGPGAFGRATQDIHYIVLEGSEAEKKCAKYQFKYTAVGNMDAIEETVDNARGIKSDLEKPDEDLVSLALDKYGEDKKLNTYPYDRYIRENLRAKEFFGSSEPAKISSIVDVGMVLAKGIPLRKVEVAGGGNVVMALLKFIQECTKISNPGKAQFNAILMSLVASTRPVTSILKDTEWGTSIDPITYDCKFEIDQCLTNGQGTFIVSYKCQVNNKKLYRALVLNDREILYSTVVKASSANKYSKPYSDIEIVMQGAVSELLGVWDHIWGENGTTLAPINGVYYTPETSILIKRAINRQIVMPLFESHWQVAFDLRAGKAYICDSESRICRIFDSWKQIPKSLMEQMAKYNVYVPRRKEE